jgi:hypothetical protein
MSIYKKAKIATTIKLSDELVNDARRYGEAYSRSVPKQIEYWSKIGKIAEQNPDLTYNFIKDMMLALKEESDGKVTAYKFPQHNTPKSYFLF